MELTPAFDKFDRVIRHVRLVDPEKGSEVVDKIFKKENMTTDPFAKRA